jgi:predicted helicase
MLEKYLTDIARRIIQNDYREESLYPALGELFEQTAGKLGAKKVDVIQQPRKTEAGNPDMRVYDGNYRSIGYVGAKRPGTDLNKIQESKQLQRYFNAFPNVILTDFFEFRLYKEGELTDKVCIGRPFVARKLGETPPVEHEEAFIALMQKFFSHSAPVTRRASSLAKELARRTRYLEHTIEVELVGGTSKELTGFYKAFQQYLIADLSKSAFADLYAQTITYGLFAARTRSTGDFTRKNARKFIPSTIGILQDVFDFISYRNLPQNIGWIVDDIAGVLNAANTDEILTRYYEKGKGDDPIIHFYETFLGEYNPDLREKRGVYYTPEPVVGYIVRSVHQLLKEKFNKPLGLADDSVTVLDPAAGTLTFITEAFKVAVDEFTQKYGEGGVPNLIKEHLLQHFYAFELMMAPYAIGHLKMGFILDELGYHLQDDERFKLYLTNTLEMEDLEQTELPGMSSLSEESRAAGKIKKKKEVLVILGNPPYSGHSANNSKWIDNSLKEGYTQHSGYKDDGYYSVDGKPLGERNSKWLQDDYVKFIRFAQWKIDQCGKGIVSMITNHGYLDNPTFRGMRESLMNSFDEISLLDLHGNYRKKEISPDGSKDENVFDIQQGVAINIMVKHSDDADKKVQREDLYGKRNKKYEWLENHRLQKNGYEELKPQSPFYFFKKQDYSLRKIYQQFISVNELFPVNSVGIVTARDHFTIHWKKAEVWRIINQFKDLPEKEARTLYELGDDTRDWKVKFAQKDIIQSGPSKDQVVPVLYRPFDKRFTYYTGNSRGFHCMPRKEVMQHMLARDNLGICVGRQWSSVGSSVYDIVFPTDSIIDLNMFRRGGELLFPLYLYSKVENGNSNGNGKKGGGTMMLIFDEEEEYKARKPNIDKEFYALLENNYSRQLNSSDDSKLSDESGSRILTPEQIMHYTYAVLYAPAYRHKYAEFLKSDFPRIPFTQNYDLFNELAELGKDLADLHLMKSNKLNNSIAKFQGKGNFVVAKPKKMGRNYQAEEERVYINKDGQYFEGISPKVWEYKIGGYQALDKWLYERRERKLGNEEIQHYCKMVTALTYTIKLQKQIDDLYPGMEANTIKQLRQ